MNTASRLRLTAATALLLSTVSTATAFDACGHKTVATIAWDHLSQATRDKINALFAQDPRHRHFINCSVWPDDIKQNKNNKNPPGAARLNKPWHYVNIPYAATPQQITTVINKPGVTVNPAVSGSANVVTAIRYYAAWLRTGQGKPYERADALSWLVHLVGDVHQPLHTLIINDPLPNYSPPLDSQGHSLDNGGGGFKLIGHGGSLHSFWDNILVPGHPPGWSSDATARTRATELQANYKPWSATVNKPDPETWARESYAQRQFVYSPALEQPADGSTSDLHIITDDYAAQAHTISTRRIVLAGRRLARLVDDIFEDL